MTKITALVQKTYQGKPSGFTVTFDDGRSGNLQEKDSDKGLRAGDEVVVTEIPYTSKAGKQSTLYGVKLAQAGSGLQPPPPPITPPLPPKPAIHVGTPKSIQELKADASIQSAKFMIDCFVANKIDWPQISENQRFLSNLLWGEIDEIFSQK